MVTGSIIDITRVRRVLIDDELSRVSTDSLLQRGRHLRMLADAQRSIRHSNTIW